MAAIQVPDSVDSPASQPGRPDSAVARRPQQARQASWWSRGRGSRWLGWAAVALVMVTFLLMLQVAYLFGLYINRRTVHPIDVWEHGAAITNTGPWAVLLPNWDRHLNVRLGVILTAVAAVGAVALLGYSRRQPWKQAVFTTLSWAALGASFGFAYMYLQFGVADPDALDLAVVTEESGAGGDSRDVVAAALAMSVPKNGPGNTGWRDAEVWLAPSVVLRQGDKDPNLFVMGVTPRRGQHPEFSLWLPTTLAENNMSLELSTQPLSGCSELSLREWSVKDENGKQTPAALQVTCRFAADYLASLPFEDLPLSEVPEYRPVVIALGGAPSYWREYQARGATEPVVAAISAYPADPTWLKAADQDPVEVISEEDYGIAGSYVSRIAGAGSALEGLPNGATRLGLGVIFQAERPGVGVALPSDSPGERIGTAVVFYGATMADSEWQARFLIAAPTDARILDGLYVVALIVLGGSLTMYLSLRAVGRRRHPEP